MTSRYRRSWGAIFGALGALFVPAFAAADEPLLAGGASTHHFKTEPVLGSEPRIMNEPGEVVDVVDAADDRDPFDINFDLGFSFSTQGASVYRGAQKLGRYSDTTARLRPRVDIGLYKDVAFYGTLPIVLSDSRSISNGSGKKTSSIFDERGDKIATFPFSPPNRSGADYLALGIDVGIMNQARHPSLPSWIAGTEVRLPIGSSLHACNAAPATGQVACANPADQNRDGKQNAGEPKDVAGLSPGVNRGTVGIEAHTYLSRRVHYVEPYGGLRGLFEIPIGSSDLAIVSKASGGRPPVQIGGAFGTLFIPWENREHFGRLTFDLRTDITVRTAGADYSEMFDVLGSSTFGELRKASYNGVTHVAAYPTGKLGSTAIWQSSRFVKLALGVSLAFSGDHHIAEASSNPIAAPTLITQNPATSLAVKGGFTFDLGARTVVMF